MPVGYRIGHRAATADQILSRPPSQAQAHCGLIFDRWLAVWDGPLESPHVMAPMRESLENFVEFSHSRRQRGQSLLDAHHQRLDNTLARRGVTAQDYQLQWRFASGLGAEHPIENGFSFDDAIGVPLVTGSAVKGLCRAAAAMRGEESAASRRALLGPEDELRTAAGDLIFYDALPLRWPKLAVDIVNCHHPEYYHQLFDERRRKPLQVTETEDPVPVFFLVVDQGAAFRFRLASRSGNAANVAQGWQWLEDGLTLLGIGAKTAVGYGVMEPVSAAKAKQEVRL